MRALIQRVLEAGVSVDGETLSRIGPGLLVLLGIEKSDASGDADRLAGRILDYRIFDDEAGRMNRSIREMEGHILVVSQFTLVADVAKGTRPSFTPAADPETAHELYARFVDQLAASGLQVETGRFGARMVVSLHNDGPVTFLLETK
jgi:D-tyrosyl-tRNA(Tyr) deacylase